MSSVTSCLSFPLMSLYAATKSFIDKFSVSSSYSSSIETLTIRCFSFSSDITYGIKPNIIIADPREIVLNSFKTLGRRRVCYGTLSHHIQYFVSLLIPDYFFASIMKVLIRFAKNLFE